MKTIFERIVSLGLTVAALMIAGTLVHREFMTARPQVAGPSPNYVTHWRELEERGVVSGSSAAPVKVTVFSDFECSFCRKFDSLYAALGAQFGNKVALVFIHYPLPNHRFAIPAARAAECAYAQHRFDAMRDALFRKQDSLGLKSWTSYAKDAGVPDTVRFLACNAEGGIPARVQAGLDAGRLMGVRGTPDVLVNGWRLQSLLEGEQLRVAIEDVLKGGVPPLPSGVGVDTLKTRFAIQGVRE